MLGKTEGKGKRGWQRIRQLYSITDSMDMNLSNLRETVKDGEPGLLQSMGSQRVGHDLATEHHQQQDAIDHTNYFCFCQTLSLNLIQSLELASVWKNFKLGIEEHSHITHREAMTSPECGTVYNTTDEILKVNVVKTKQKQIH